MSDATKPVANGGTRTSPLTPLTKKKEPLLSRNFVFAVLAICFLYVSYQMVATQLGPYVNSFGGSASLNGIISLAWTITAVIARPLAGGFADSFGSKKVAITGGLVFAVSTFLTVLFPSTSGLLILRIVQACGHASAITGALTAAANSVPSSRAGEGAFYFNGFPQVCSMLFGGNLGVLLVGVAGVSFWGSDGDYFLVFLVSALLMIPFILFNLLQKKDSRTETRAAEIAEKQSHEIHGKGIFKFIELTAVLPAILYLLTAISNQGLQSYVTLFAMQNELSGVGLFFTANALAQLAVCLFAGRITDKLGFIAVLVPGMIICGLSYTYLFFDGVNFIIVGILWGFGAGLMKSPCIAMAMRRAPKGRMGASQGTLNISFVAGLGLASFIWGFVIDAFGFSGLFLGSMIASVVVMILIILVVRKMKIPGYTS